MHISSKKRTRVSKSIVFLFYRAVFLSIMLGILSFFAIFLLLLHTGYLHLSPSSGRPLFVLGFIALLSLLVSAVTVRLVGEKIFAPIRELKQAAGKVADGDFSVSVQESGDISEIREMSHSFNCMVQELRHTEIVHSDFISTISHEFRTPLSSIEGYAMLLQTPSLSAEKQMEYTSRIIEGTKRLSALTGNILTLSRLENRQVGVSRTLFALDEQLRQVVLLYETQWVKKEIELDLELEPIRYAGSEELLYQVWQNLFENAVKFCDQGGHIAVRCKQKEEGIFVVFINDGTGIAEADLAHIFEKFYQSERSRSTQGNGLGLTLAKRITELHGGSITARSSAEEGTVFTVILPSI
ncbi:MAG: HAMP domain-containing sensor histidine kinase [Eubacteriales bacterium]|nr:HAMP domain-containing sensor histidine kinase [Eubacteriales bacterium]